MEWKMKMGELIKQIGWVRLVLLLICGIFLIIVSLPEKEGDLSKGQTVTERKTFDYEVDENDMYVEKMEERLAGILELMEGAGRVEVMITLASSSETIINKDQTYEEASEKEGSGDGKEAVSSLRKEETVFSEKDGDQNPYILKTVEPAVEGIIIVMDGGNISSVSSAVTEAVQALFHIDAHKIKVLKMEDGS